MRSTRAERKLAGSKHSSPLSPSNLSVWMFWVNFNKFQSQA